MMPEYVCIDIGGTTIKYGVTDGGGRFLAKGKAPNPICAGGVGAMVSLAISRIRAYQKEYSPVGLAVATTGIVDASSGTVLYAAEHLPGYTGTRLQAILEEACGLPCRVENDVNCAGMGEYWLGAGRGADLLVCLTVGTGIGGSVIFKGQLVPGASHCAGEVGYLRIGEPGTLESLASASRLIAETAEAKGMPADEVNGELVFAWARAGDPSALATAERMVQRLAAGIANVCYVLNPEVVVLGGGIMAQEGFLKPRLLEALRAALLPRVYAGTRFAFAQLGNDAGMIGALYCLLHEGTH
jgi:predicted NBD/HSP70 family sugar kinase